MNAGKSYWHFDGGQIGLRRLCSQERGRPLLCFPHAGAQSLAFRQLADSLPDFTVYGVDPPGHGWAGGQPIADMDSLLDKYLRHLPQEILFGAILLGHSMGAYVAFRMTQELTGRSATPPALILSAARPPHRRTDVAPLGTLPDGELREALARVGGLPEDAYSLAVLDRFLPAIRADFVILEGCQVVTAEPCQVPTLVLGGTQDDFVSPWHIAEWVRYVPNSQIEWLDSGHFFAQSHPAQMAQHISKFLGPVLK